MLDPNVGDTDAIVDDLTAAMEGVVTAEISCCVRDAVIDGRALYTGEYIGFIGKTLLAADDDRVSTVFQAIDGIDLSHYEVCLLFCGKNATDEEVRRIEEYVTGKYRGKELYILDGGQEIYDYIIVAYIIVAE